MTALPAELPNRLSNSPTIKSAYLICLQFEQSAKTHPDPKRLIYARLLGYLMLAGPSDGACVAVAREVLSCADDDALALNGKMYYDHYIYAFKKVKCRTPIPSRHISPPSFDTRKAMITGMLVEVPQSHRDAKKNALIRDGFRCVVTGFYEKSMVENNKELEKLSDEEGWTLNATDCAHIFAESDMPDANEGSNKHHYAASLWAVMDRFGYQRIPSDLNGNNIHRLENVLTLDVGVRCLFDELKLWFEPTDTSNTYKLTSPSPRYIAQHYKTSVTFTTPDPEKLPLPSPEYLSIHAACAKVAHLSGAGQHIDKVLRELEDTKVLSKDGSSAEALEHALLPTNLLCIVTNPKAKTDVLGTRAPPSPTLSAIDTLTLVEVSDCILSDAVDLQHAFAPVRLAASADAKQL
ncbi:hypothetical protein D9615_008803 [Tricholomella constricta]|uniref:HNH nuclease domain-containing protein n=1 Tax=Tricholomella constricta TaxID=117010 RepID=A0A8H5H7S7_9AGAR|nr:hypothetical protein D9615_008803 [Tricholomella constricta]